MNTKLREQRSDEGFTLIELLGVIVVLGILAAVAVFAVGGVTTESKKSGCKSDVKIVEVAQEAHKAQKGAYAASVDALVTAGYIKAGSAPPAAVNTATGDYWAVTTSSTGAAVSSPADCAITS